MKRTIPWLIVAFLLGLIIGQPSASNANSNQNTGYSFCVNKKSGALRQLLKGSCNAKTENTLRLGAQGPQGAPGEPGPAGAVGPQGLPGVGVEFRIVDATGMPIDRIVELDLDGTDPSSFLYGNGDLSFTRLIDGWLWRYTFDNAAPTSPWAAEINVYYLNEFCNGTTYTDQQPLEIHGISTSTQRLLYNVAAYETGGVVEYYRYGSTESLQTDTPIGVWRLEGGAIVSDGRGNQWWEPPVCESAGTNSYLWQINRYTIPSNVFVETPVSIEWLN